MSLLNKLFGNKEVYNHVPAECEYYVLCESQYGTQQCSMKIDDCLKCDRRQSYINENAGTDIATERQKQLYGMK